MKHEEAQIGRRFQATKSQFDSTFFVRRFRRNVELTFDLMMISRADFTSLRPDFHCVYIGQTHFLKNGSKF